MTGRAAVDPFRQHQLPSKQDDVRSRGHAIEVRAYAEAPEARFAPTTGKVWRSNTRKRRCPRR